MAKKAKAKRASKTATKKSASKSPARVKSAIKQKMVNYPVAETLQWVADGEKLLIKWGAIKSPGAKRIANTVASVLSVLQALTELRKS